MGIRKLRLAAVPTGSLSGDLVERDREVTLVCISDLMRYLGNRQIRVAQQRLRSIDPAVDYVAMWGEPQRLPEGMSKVIGTHRQCL